jgi:hypothetical protein
MDKIEITNQLYVYIIRILQFRKACKAQGIIITLLFFVVALFAENITGHVYLMDKTGYKKPLSGANVFFTDSYKSAVTDSSGFFSINKEKRSASCLVASYTGFGADSLIIPVDGINQKIEMTLKEGVQLSGAVVLAKGGQSLLPRLTVQKTELITHGSMLKMACCNLSESFENSATVTVGFADAVTGAKQVQMLGLSGIYSQMLLENIPTMRGLAASFGWSHTPSPWLESIQISKGASSVINGYESVTGQINLEYKKPDKVEDLYIDLYADNMKKYEINLTGARRVSKNLWSNLLLHASTQNNPHDKNNDHFMDMPQTKFVSAFNRWLYVNPEKKLESRTGIKFLYEDRKGGQSPKCHTADVYYITDIVNKDFNLYNKTGVFIGDKPGQSIAVINSLTHHELDSYFGSDKTYKLYYGTQNSLYTNVLFSSYIGNSNHQYTTGVSFVYDNYKTFFRDKLPENNTPLTALNREEVLPGIFGQYTFSLAKKFTLIAGLREDYNNKYGWLFTPRGNIRYDVNDNIILRASTGCGYRAPNVLADNIGLLASTRKIEIDAISGLQIEKAWNYGGNVTFYVPVRDDEKLILSFDYFHTNFINQAITDLDRDKNEVYIYNLKGKSYADAWQADLSFSPFNRFSVFTAFRYNLSMITLTDGTQSYLVEKPLTSRYRGLINLGYGTKFRKWLFDITAQLNGPTRIPGLTGYTTVRTESPVFPVYFAQITKNTKRLSIYAGVENILNYKQKNPILNYENPFVKGFDASLIWGPLMGRIIYGGIRLKIGKQY